MKKVGSFPGEIKRLWAVIFLRPENLLWSCWGLQFPLLSFNPLAILVWKSFQVEKGSFTSVYSLENYARLLSSEPSGDGEQLLSSEGAAPYWPTGGVILAWITARTDVPSGECFNLEYYAILHLPLIGAIAWTFLASPGWAF